MTITQELNASYVALDNMTVRAQYAEEKLEKVIEIASTEAADEWEEAECYRQIRVLVGLEEESPNVIRNPVGGYADYVAAKMNGELD